MGSELVAGEHMNAILASGADILSTPWGMAVFILFDIVVLVLIMALNYLWIFKRVLDILFSAVFLAVFFPFFLVFLLADAIYNKTQNAYRTLFTTEYYAGKKEKIIRVTTFSTERIVHDESGKLLPLEERITKMGKVLRACGMKYYPALLSVFAGGLSFVGPRPMALADAAAVGEDAQARFSVRPAPHTTLGGLEIDPDGATSVPGLFAAGECTGGIHGRDRLGGNAGLETLVFGRIAGSSAARYAASAPRLAFRESPPREQPGPEVFAEIAAIFDRCVTVCDEPEKLREAKRLLALLPPFPVVKLAEKVCERKEYADY